MYDLPILSLLGAIVFGIYCVAVKSSYRETVKTADHLLLADFSSKTYPGQPFPEFCIHTKKVKGIQSVLVMKDINTLAKKGIHQHFEYWNAEGKVISMNDEFTESLERYKKRVRDREMKVGSWRIDRIHKKKNGHFISSK
jgi:hypothetical protein